MPALKTQTASVIGTSEAPWQLRLAQGCPATAALASTVRKWAARRLTRRAPLRRGPPRGTEWARPPSAGQKIKRAAPTGLRVDARKSLGSSAGGGSVHPFVYVGVTIPDTGRARARQNGPTRSHFWHRGFLGPHGPPGSPIRALSSRAWTSQVIERKTNLAGLPTRPVGTARWAVKGPRALQDAQKSFG